MLSATGGFARADCDDTYLCGEPAEVARVLVEFETAIAEVGAELQRPKSAALLGATCALPPTSQSRSVSFGTLAQFRSMAK